MRKLSLIVLFVLGFMAVKAQQLLTENFSYTAGQSLTANGWTQNGFPPTNPINVTSSGLSYSGYVLSGIGNAAYLNNNGVDVYQAGISNVTSGPAYASFMYKVDTVKTGDYFFGLLSSINPNTYVARVYLRAAATGYYKVGFAKNNEAAVYSNDSFALGSVNMMVVKYSVAAGSNTNDTATLYHFTSGFPLTEPSTYLLRATGGTTVQDANNISRIALRQGVVTQAPSLTVDGFRLAQSWADLHTNTSNKPGPLQFVFVNNITATTARINFTKHPTYRRDLHNVLLFLKKGDTIAAGTPTRSISYYQADSNFAGSGTPFEYDTAVCVYNGDSTLVNITGLTPSTRYRVIGYAVSEGDSAYSTGVLSTVFTTTTTAPGQAFALQFVASSTMSANITWFKNPNYNNANHTTMVYIKELSAITTGVNDMNPISIFPDTNYNGIGTRYKNDTAARCVYNGDGTSVSVSGLKPGTRYYLLLLGASVADSNYATPSTGNGITPTGGPGAPTNFRFTGRYENNSTVSWTKPAGYADSTHTILVFMRKDTFNYIFPAASRMPNLYVADSNFAGNGTRFEGDTAAKCIYNGDGNITGVTNLQINSRYYLLIYAVKSDSGLYSLVNIINNRTMVDSVTNIKVIGNSATSVSITWTTPPNYQAGIHQALVFVKAGSPMTVGTPTRAVNRYTANTNFGAGTKYQNDTAAYCVYRATGTTLTVNNLKFGTTYYATVFIVRVVDSVYNRANTGFGNTLDQPDVRDIGPLVRTVNTNGVIDSNNVRATVRGIVYGGNNRTAGVQFVIRDATGGILIYHTTKNFGYTTITEGDSVEVVGTASQLNGTAIMTLLDTIKKLDINKPIASPRIIGTKLDETTENELVQFGRVSFFTATANWPTNGNVNVKNSYTGDTIIVRVYQNSPLSGKAAPTGEFSLTGMGGQATVSANAPFPFNNYRIVPRTAFDISMNTGDSLSNFKLLTPSNPISTIALDGDTNQTFNIVCSSAQKVRGLGTVNYVALFDESTGDFSLPMFGKPSNNSGVDTVTTITYGEMRNSLSNLFPGDSVIIRVTMMANFNSVVKLADQKRLIIFKLAPLPTSVSEVFTNADVKVYPNPTREKIFVKSSRELVKISLLDLQGKELLVSTQTAELDLSNLQNGIYLLQVESKDGVVFKRVQLTR